MIDEWFTLCEGIRKDSQRTYPLTDEETKSAFVRTIFADNMTGITQSWLDDANSADLINCIVLILAFLKEIKEQRFAYEDVGIGACDLATLSMNPQRSSTTPPYSKVPAEPKWVAGTLGAVFHMAMLKEFFVTKDLLMGMGPAGTQTGDIIALFAGAETPFVLRPVTEESQENAETFKLVHATRDPGGRLHVRAASDDEDELGSDEFTCETMVCTVVGECYVHGIMDGAFMEFTDRLRMFELH